MAFNKGILMLAIIAFTGIFEATCLTMEMKQDILNAKITNKCRKYVPETKFDGLMIAALQKYEMCEIEGIFVPLRHRENTSAPFFSVQSDYKILCDTTTRLIKCGEWFFDQLLFCDDQSSVEKRNLIGAALHSYKNYMCSDDAKRIAAFVEQSACIEKSIKSAECVQTIFQRRDMHAEIEILNKNSLPKIQQCISNVLTQCPNTDPSFSPLTSAEKLIDDFKSLARSIVEVVKSADVFDENFDSFFLLFAF